MEIRPLDQAIEELRAMTDPYARLREARALDDALVMARRVVAEIKRETVESLRGASGTGYGGIARRLGLTKARVQQIANTARGLPAAFAFRDQDGTWYGEPRLLPQGRYSEAPSFIAFSPADECNPLSGQVLTVRYGEVPEGHGVSAYTMQVRLDNGSPFNLRMTRPVQDALFGPPILGTPERAQWDMAREQRRRQLACQRAIKTPHPATWHGHTSPASPAPHGQRRSESGTWPSSLVAH